MLVSVCTIARNEEEYLPPCWRISQNRITRQTDRSCDGGQQFNRWNQTDYGTFC